MAKIITKKKEVEYQVAVAYDGTTFSEEQFGSIDAAKAEADKYDLSAVSIVTQRAMRILKPYVLPDKHRPLEEQAESVKEYCKNYDYVARFYKNPQQLMVECIVALYSGESFLTDACKVVYVFKPKSHEDIDIVTQYLNLNGTPCHSYKYESEKYGDIGKILDRYRQIASAEQITLGKTYILFVAPDIDSTFVVDVHKWLSKVSELVDDVDINY